MKIVYIAHPVSGDVAGNIEKIIAIVRKINLGEPEVIPFAPYLADLYALDDSNPAERKRGMENGQMVLSRGFVDEMWLYGPRISDGMIAEANVAHALGIPVVDLTGKSGKND